MKAAAKSLGGHARVAALARARNRARLAMGNVGGSRKS
jgi:hypothetical protein